MTTVTFAQNDGTDNNTAYVSGAQYTLLFTTSTAEPATSTLGGERVHDRIANRKSGARTSTVNPFTASANIALVAFKRAIKRVDCDVSVGARWMYSASVHPGGSAVSKPSAVRVLKKYGSPLGGVIRSSTTALFGACTTDALVSAYCALGAGVCTASCVGGSQPSCRRCSA